VRTPMQWNGDRNAGFSRTDPQALYLPLVIDPAYHYHAINVETQRRVPSSLLNWMRRLIAIRKRYPVFGRGTIEFLHPSNLAILAYIRSYEDQTILVINNLSRFVQPAELDLSAFKDSVPVELFGETVFPRIGDAPYFLSLGPHTFYWFRLERSSSP
jgi:maltose alpha-D-glucosyltransferase/alpha-amylase